MCSILGLIDFDNKYPSKNEKIFNLNKLLSHRGPDDEGYFNDEYISLAFNRLSIIDLNAGNQPIIRNDIISIFNGEIYNFKSIRKELETLNYKFETNTDSEIIPFAFSEWGIDFVKKLSGMFSIALYDKKKGKIYLFRDRIGIKPLFYSNINDGLIFSSEVKGIINFPGFEKKIDYTGVYSYLSFRYPTNNNNYFFKNIKRLNPGHYLEININLKKITEHKYWNLKINKPKYEKNENFYLEKLDQLLNDAVKSHLQSDVPVGVFLSGGLDSSLLAAIATKHHVGKLKTYSVGFKEAKYNEGNKAKLISNHINSDHTEIVIEKKDFFENLQKIIEIKDAPISIPHEYPLYALTQKMRGDVKVVLSGEGADEFFGGYSRVQKSPFDYKKGKFIHSFIKSPLIKEIFSLEKNFDFKNKNLIDYFFEKYNWFNFKETDDLLTNKIKNEVDLKSVLEPWAKNFDNSKNKSYDQILSSFQENHLQCLLDRLDIMTMANSIEARVPFLDNAVVEFINNVPFKYKIKWKSSYHKFKSLFSNSSIYTENNDINKYLLRKCSEKYLPQNTSMEKKLGFPLPMNEWMRDDRIKEILLDSTTLNRKIFNKDKIEKLLKIKKETNDPYDFSGKKIWMLVNLEIWMRCYIDSK
tara:strand:- start:5082 stop:6998 length:1917 start_codon:yes stop_codon:yes gene_type:complete